MSDGGDDGDFAACDGEDDFALVECPEVFEGATAACEDDGVDGVALACIGDEVECADDGGCGAFALDGDIDERDVDGGAAPAECVEDILERCAGLGCDDGDAAREGREWFLAGGVEVAFGLELLEEGAVAGFEWAGADLLDALDIELRASGGCVVLDSAGGEDAVAACGREADGACGGAEHHAVDGGVLVLEVEVPVGAVGEGADLGDDLDPRGEPLGECGFDGAGELGDGEGVCWDAAPGSSRGCVIGLVRAAGFGWVEGESGHG